MSLMEDDNSSFRFNLATLILRTNKILANKRFCLELCIALNAGNTMSRYAYQLSDVLNNCTSDLYSVLMIRLSRSKISRFLLPKLSGFRAGVAVAGAIKGSPNGHSRTGWHLSRLVGLPRPPPPPPSASPTKGLPWDQGAAGEEVPWKD